MKNKQTIMAFLLVLLLVSCRTQPQQTFQTQPLPEKEHVQIQDGVQVVTLSWGKLNYEPEVIRVKKDMPVRIIGDMKRLTGCYQIIVIPELDLKKTFTLFDDSLEFTPTKAGTYGFGCAMGMGGGQLVVE